jgi:hypothetical protein
VSLELGRSPDDEAADADAGTTGKPGSGPAPTAATVPTTQFRLLSTMPPDPDEDEPADTAEPVAGGTHRVVPGEVADTAKAADSEASGSASADSPDTAKLRTGSAGRAPSDDAADTAKLRTGGDAADTARPTGGSARRPPSGAAAGPSRHATGRLDGPLLADTAGLRASWHRVQASFVDDPRGAVSDAADLVDHTAQALIGALRLRQNQLRGMWETTGVEDRGRGLLGDGGRIPFLGRGRRGDSRWDDNGGTYPAGGGHASDSGPAGNGGVPPADGNAGPAGGPIPDSTERLRLVMQQYRALFNQICRP